MELREFDWGRSGSPQGRRTGALRSWLAGGEIGLLGSVEAALGVLGGRPPTRVSPEFLTSKQTLKSSEPRGGVLRRPTCTGGLLELRAGGCWESPSTEAPYCFSTSKPKQPGTQTEPSRRAPRASPDPGFPVLLLLPSSASLLEASLAASPRPFPAAKGQLQAQGPWLAREVPPGPREQLGLRSPPHSHLSYLLACFGSM